MAAVYGIGQVLESLFSRRAGGRAHRPEPAGGHLRAARVRRGVRLRRRARALAGQRAARGRRGALRAGYTTALYADERAGRSKRAAIAQQRSAVAAIAPAPGDLAWPSRPHLREFPARRQRRGGRPPARAARARARRSTSGARPAAARRSCCTRLQRARRRASRRMVRRPIAAPWSLPTTGAGSSSTIATAFDAAQQHAAFTLFVEAASRAAARGRRCARRQTLPPVDLPVREDLRTRLGWGPVHALQPLAEPTPATPCARRPPPRHRPGRRGARLHAGPLRARPQEPDAPAAPPRRLRAGREARHHRAAAQAHARRRAATRDSAQ